MAAPVQLHGGCGKGESRGLFQTAVGVIGEFVGGGLALVLELMLEPVASWRLSLPRRSGLRAPTSFL